MRALLGILICLCAQQVLADTRYVSDNIFTYIHNGPGTQYRILGSVKAGEPLEVKAVNNDAGFTQVVDGRGREGWIKNSELQAEISLRERLPQVQKELDEARARLLNLNGDNERRFAEKDGQITEQSKEIASLKAQLASQSTEDVLFSALAKPGIQQKISPFVPLIRRVPMWLCCPRRTAFEPVNSFKTKPHSW